MRRHLIRSLVPLVVVMMANAALSGDSFWWAEEGNLAFLTDRNISSVSHQVQGLVGSYADGKSSSDSFSRHNLDLEEGQTAELTIHMHVTQGSVNKVWFGVLPWCGNYEFYVGGLGYAGTAPIHADLWPGVGATHDGTPDVCSNWRTFEVVTDELGFGMRGYATDVPCTIIVKCLSARFLSHSASGGDWYEYTYSFKSTALSYSQLKTVEVLRRPGTPGYAYARGGITLYASLMNRSHSSHRYQVAYTVDEKLYWTSSGGGTTAPANDNFASATKIDGESGEKTGNNKGATLQSGEPLPVKYSSVGKTIWYRWTAPSAGQVQFDTVGSDFNTMMGVYTGSSLSSLSQVAADDDGGGSLTSKCAFSCESGIPYYICVGGNNEAAGSVKLNWSLVSDIAIPPSAPTGVTATDGTYSDKVTVSWSSASGATSYNLYRSTSSMRPSSPTKTDVTSPCSDTMAEPGVMYYYWIEAVNSFGSSVSSHDTGYCMVTLSLDKSSESFAVSGGTRSSYVTANTLWNATTDASWITLETASGRGNGTLTYTVCENMLASSRTGTVVVTVGLGTAHSAEPRMITIKQSGLPPPIPADLYVDIVNGSDSHVGTSWAQSFSSIQKAIDTAKDGQTIVVNDGVYAPVDAKGKTLTIRSVNGAKCTTIDGADTSRCATLSPGRTTLVGFALTNGRAGKGECGAGALGGVLRECILSSCNAASLGFGGGAASNALFWCVIEGNRATAGGGGWECQLHDCIISNNLSGVYSRPPQDESDGRDDPLYSLIASMSGCGGGIVGGSATRCIICNNRNNGSGSLGYGGAGASKLESCLVVSNVTNGSLEEDDRAVGGVGDCVCLNCTIVGNKCLKRGASDVCRSILTNCIVKGDSAVSVRNSECFHVCANDATVIGIGMIYVDPQFVDEAGGDFRLKETSPCVNAGDLSVVSASVDISGRSRIFGNSVDLGAYEWFGNSSIAFSANGGEGLMARQTIGCGCVYKLPKCTLTPPAGKSRFAGWACSNGRRYDDEMLVFDLGNVMMTAIWE